MKTPNELIPVSRDYFDGEELLSADARCLHKFLGVGRVFAAWIKERIEKYDFQEGIDFIALSNSGKRVAQDGGANRIDYILTIDMAKELAMIENNDKGHQVRRYFLQCEKIAKKEVKDAAVFKKKMESWRHYIDRMDITKNKVPRGYFGIWQEIAVMIPHLIEAGLTFDDRIAPDGSVGKHWATYWRDNHLAETFGEKTRYEHNYPDYFRQAESNPQKPNAYPVGAIGLFRDWLWDIYIPEKFPQYIKDKLDVETAQRAVLAFEPQARLKNDIN